MRLRSWVGVRRNNFWQKTIFECENVGISRIDPTKTKIFHNIVCRLFVYSQAVFYKMQPLTHSCLLPLRSPLIARHTIIQSLGFSFGTLEIFTSSISEGIQMYLNVFLKRTNTLYTVVSAVSWGRLTQSCLLHSESRCPSHNNTIFGVFFWNYWDFHFGDTRRNVNVYWLFFLKRTNTLYTIDFHMSFCIE